MIFCGLDEVLEEVLRKIYVVVGLDWKVWEVKY